MAAPTATARQTPVGRKLWDGDKTLITLASDPDISFWESADVQPPGVEGGDPINITPHGHDGWVTKRARSRKEMTPCSTQVFYDESVLDQIVAQINNETTITITFIDGSTWAFYGYLRSFIPDAVNAGEPCTAAVTFEPTNYDVTNNTEEGPVVAAVAGT